MSAFRFLHAADLHLDTPFEGIAAVRPELAAALRDASLDAFDRLVEAAIDRRVEFVALAGDVYDGAERGVRAQLRLRRGLERLAAAGIRAFLAHGNHDPVEADRSAVAAWPPGVHVFRPDRVETVAVERDGARLAAVHGVSFGRRAEDRNLAAAFRADPGPGLQVGVLHCNVGGRLGHDPYAPCSLEDLRGAGLHYWALGHVHAREVLLDGPVWAVYPGNLQGRSPKPAERGGKGAMLVEADVDGVRSVRFLPLAPVAFEAVEVDATGAADLAELEERIAAAAIGAADVPGRRGTILAVTVTGRTPLHRAVAAGVDELRAALDDRLLGGGSWIWIERLELRTAPPLDRARLAAGDDLAGLLLRRIDALRADPVALAALLAEVDGELAGAAVGRSLVPAGADEAAGLLAWAEVEILERLGGEA